MRRAGAARRPPAWAEGLGAGPKGFALTRGFSLWATFSRLAATGSGCALAWGTGWNLRRDFWGYSGYRVLGTLGRTWGYWAYWWYRWCCGGLERLGILRALRLLRMLGRRQAGKEGWLAAPGPGLATFDEVHMP